MASRIKDYGLIGNTRTSALVSRAGSIDWLCGPRFDSDAWFAVLVGYDEHGRWALRPTVPVREMAQRYRDDTMTLETEFVCDGGAVRVTDFMPVSEDQCDVVRIVDGLDGEVPLEMLLDVRFGYDHDTPWVWPVSDGVRFTAGPDTVLLRAPIPIRMAGSRVSAYPRVRKGDRVPLQLTCHPSHESAPAPLNAEQGLASTDAFWLGWARRCTYQGHWRDSVMRSLLTLKALAYAPTGAIVAAHHVAPGGHRRRAQLGLSLLLDAGRQPDDRRAHDRRLPGGGPRLPGLGAARRRR